MGDEREYPAKYGVSSAYSDWTTNPFFSGSTPFVAELTLTGNILFPHDFLASLQVIIQYTVHYSSKGPDGTVGTAPGSDTRSIKEKLHFFLSSQAGGLPRIEPGSALCILSTWPPEQGVGVFIASYRVLCHLIVANSIWPQRQLFHVRWWVCTVPMYRYVIARIALHCWRRKARRYDTVDSLEAQRYSWIDSSRYFLGPQVAEF